MKFSMSLNEAITSGLIIFGLYITLRQFKLSKTLDFIHRYNDPSYVNIRASVDKWLDSKKSVDEKLNQLENDKELAAKVTILINLFTELGVAVKERIVNIPVTFNLWDPALLNYWDKLEFYIQDSRAKGNQIGHNYERLVKLLKRYKQSKFLRIIFWFRLGI